MWTVPARVERVIDGDTIDVTLDLGWRLYKRDHVRLAGINAPEKNTPEGVVARDRLAELLGDYADVILTSTGLDKYGRALALVSLRGVDLSHWMLDHGLAKPWDGQGARPV